MPHVLLETHPHHNTASITVGSICILHLLSPKQKEGEREDFSPLYLVMKSHNPLNEEAKKGELRERNEWKNI